MARVDTSIYGQNPLRSVAQNAGDWAALDEANMRRQVNQLALQDRQRGIQDDTAIRNAMAGIGPNATIDARISALETTGLPKGFSAADALRKNKAEQVKAEAQATEQKTKASVEHLKLVNHHMNVIAASPTPEVLEAAIKDIETKTGVPSGSVGAALRSAAGDPQKLAQIATTIALDTEKRLPKIQTVDQGQYQVTSGIDPVSLQETPVSMIRKAVTPDTIARVEGQAAEGAADRAARTAQADADRAARTKSDEAGKYTQVVIDPERGPLVVDKKNNTFTEVKSASGEKIPGKNPAAAKQLSDRLAVSIAEARRLIPEATGSGVGRAVDYATSTFGVSTKGDDAASQLETLAGWMTSNVPRMQGPQSDKDTLLYRQMAAQVGDRSKTRSSRLKALETLEGLQKKYSESTADLPTSLPAMAPSGSYSDAEKERRYQEWKAKQK